MRWFTFVYIIVLILFTFVFYICKIIIYICNYEFKRKNFKNHRIFRTFLF